MKLTAILLTATLALSAFLLPVASATGGSDSAGTICIPPGGPVGGCTEFGFSNQPVYYTDVDVSNWQMTCAWVACVMTPQPTLSSEYLTDAPLPYSAGEVCIKTSCRTWDTRHIAINTDILA